MVCGRQVGNVQAREHPNAMAKGRVIWRHGRDSLRRMWEIVGSKTGTMWKVEAEVTALDRNKDGGGSVWRDDGTGHIEISR
jgi:hypothetical protein